jgi:methylphosphotriester-DNA--protein-cysteine methyltransferase
LRNCGDNRDCDAENHRAPESLSGLDRESLRDVSALLPAAPDGGRRRAGALASSPRQLQRAFEEVGETSFGAYLREVRLRNAAELLVRQPLTVGQVALRGRQPPQRHMSREAPHLGRPRTASRTLEAPWAPQTIETTAARVRFAV